MKLETKIYFFSICLLLLLSVGTITGKDTDALRAKFSEEISKVTGIATKRIKQFFNMVKNHPEVKN